MRRTVFIYLLFVCFVARPVLAEPEEVQDEPKLGAPAPTPAPTPAPPAAESQTQVLERARRECRADAPCPLFAELMALLRQPEVAGETARLLGELGDPRAVMPLAQGSVYGATPELRVGHSEALRAVVKHAAARLVAASAAQTEVDPAVRGALVVALGGEGALRQASTPGVGVQSDAAQPVPKPELTDPESTRVAYGPTAFGRKKGTWNWTIYNIGYWCFDYGVTDNFEVGMQTIPPLGMVAFMPNFKVSAQLGEHVAIGLRGLGGVVYPYVLNDDHWLLAVYGGGPILTLGSPNLLFNLSVPIYGLTIREHDTDSIWAVTPNLGFSWRAGRRVKLNIEVHTPLGKGMDDDLGKIWLLIYGVRVFGEHIYGDINFVMPFFPGFDEVMKYIPVGFPMLAFGFQW